MVKHHLEVFWEDETVEFNRIDWDNSVIFPVTDEVKAKITNLKKKPQI